MSESNRVNIIYAEESSFNGTPSTPLSKEVRFVSDTLDHLKETVESDELRDDRQVEDIVEVGVGASGDLQTEVSFANCDDIIAAGLGSTYGAFSGETIDKATIQVVNATAKLIRSDVG